MPEQSDSQSRLKRFLLMLMLCLAIAAFGAAYDQPIAWSFVLPCVLSVFWQIPRLPAWLRVGTRYAAHLFELLAVGLGFIFMAYPILSAQTATHLSLIAGYGLCAFASLFLLGLPVWTPPSALWPAALGLLIVDCFNPDAQIRPLLVGPGLAALFYLALPGLGSNLRKAPAARWMRLAGFAVVAAVVSTALILGTPQVQSQTEKMRFQFAESHMRAYSGLSTTTRLGDLEELQLSPTVVMRVWTDHPQDLRARAYLRFDGRGWMSNPGLSTNFEAGTSQADSNPELHNWLQSIPGTDFAVPGSDSHQLSDSVVHTRIVQKLFNNGMMVSPGSKLLVRADLPSLRLDPQENLLPPPAGGVEIYGVISNNDGSIVRRAPATVTEIAEALQFPADTDSRIRDLALRLAAGASSPEERLNRTVGYLQRDYQYTLKVGSFHSSQPVAEFLFEKKAGYCQYFATAAALLLRIEGVPARYVTGFHIEENSRSGDHYVVREMDAHAWIEAYIPGKGWVQADPTPASEYASLHAGLSHGWFANLVEWVQARAAEIVARVTSADWRSAIFWLWMKIRAAAHWLLFTGRGLSVCSLVVAGWLGRRFYRKRKASAKIDATKEPTLGRLHVEDAPELALLLKRLDAYWNRCGAARPAHRTPLEHLATISAEKMPAEMRKVSREIIENYYRASFGGMSPSEEEVRKLQGHMEEPTLKHAQQD